MAAITFLCTRPLRRFLWLAALWLGGLEPGIAQPNSAPQMEAACLINFLKYVESPASNRNTSSLCLFGRDTLDPLLSSHEGRIIGGKELRIRRVSSPADMVDCQLVYLPDTEEARIGSVLRWTHGMPVLTVSSAESFARAGGIELVRGDRRFQFIVSEDTLLQHGLTASSHMMRLGFEMIGGTR